MRKIAAEPHSRENLVGELKLYPEAREYRITVRSGKTADELQAAPEIVAKEKTVQGRYIVTTAMLPGADDPMIMVVSYDKASDTFKKWILLPNGFVGASTGVADMEKRTIAWISENADAEPPTTVLVIETHSDDRSTWKETTLQGGHVISCSQGVAIRTK